MLETQARHEVLTAMSGGVDSAAAALLLMGAGREVKGAVLRFSAASDKCVREAEAACRKLDIALSVVDVRADFERLVVSPFCSQYCEGRTPNPCVVCNPKVKFAALLREAEGLGCDYIASGHYARIEERECFYIIKKARCVKRDQSYMLCSLPQEILSRLLLPLGEIESKEEARALAAAAGLECSKAPDSQEICFIPEGDYASFIHRRGLFGKRGRFIAPNGEALGEHRGTENYTVGQRRGLRLSLKEPVYVKEIESGGDVRLGFAGDMFSSKIGLSDFSLNPYYEKNGVPETLFAKIRSAAIPAPCRLELMNESRALLRFETDVRAPAPGQQAVVYDGELLAGSGVIDAVY